MHKQITIIIIIMIKQDDNFLWLWWKKIQKRKKTFLARAIGSTCNFKTVFPCPQSNKFTNPGFVSQQLTVTCNLLDPVWHSMPLAHKDDAPPSHPSRVIACGASIFWCRWWANNSILSTVLDQDSRTQHCNTTSQTQPSVSVSILKRLISHEGLGWLCNKLISLPRKFLFCFAYPK